MAEVQQSGGGEEKKGRPKKQTLRVDFTPMVDMNLLLITFFMFTTTLSKPQIMQIAMPTDQKPTEEQEVKTKESKTITLILGENNNLYYYEGLPNYEDWTSLKKTDYSAEGIRKVLLERNAPVVAKMRELNAQRANKEITEEVYQERAKEIRDDKDGQTVLIRPTEASNYKNLVDALDEMQITSIGRYVIDDMKDADNFVLENYRTQGAYGASAAAPN